MAESSDTFFEHLSTVRRLGRLDDDSKEFVLAKLAFESAVERADLGKFTPVFIPTRSRNRTSEIIPYRGLNYLVHDLGLLDIFQELNFHVSAGSRWLDLDTLLLRIISERLYLKNDILGSILFSMEFEKRLKRMEQKWDFDQFASSDRFSDLATVIQSVFVVAHEIAHLEMRHFLDRRVMFLDRSKQLLEEMDEAFEVQYKELQATESGSENSKNETHDDNLDNEWMKFYTKQYYKSGKKPIPIKHRDNSELLEEIACDLSATKLTLDFFVQKLEFSRLNVILAILLSMHHLTFLNLVNAHSEMISESNKKHIGHDFAFLHGQLNLRASAFLFVVQKHYPNTISKKAFPSDDSVSYIDQAANLYKRNYEAKILFPMMENMSTFMTNVVGDKTMWELVRTRTLARLEEDKSPMAVVNYVEGLLNRLDMKSPYPNLFGAYFVNSI